MLVRPTEASRRPCTNFVQLLTTKFQPLVEARLRRRELIEEQEQYDFLSVCVGCQALGNKGKSTAAVVLCPFCDVGICRTAQCFNALSGYLEDHPDCLGRRPRTEEERELILAGVRQLLLQAH